jgi:uncharacterized protein (TIGR03437 family)
VIQVFTTGLGETLPPLEAGRPGASSEPFHRAAVAPEAFIGGVRAEVLFAGVAPGFAGLYQVNVRIPPGTPAGPDVPLMIAGGWLDSNTVPIAVSPAPGK